MTDVDRKVTEGVHAMREERAASSEGGQPDPKERADQSGSGQWYSSGRLVLQLSALRRVKAIGPRTVIGIAVALLVLVVAAGVYLMRENRSDSAIDTARTDALNAGTSALETLLSYDYREIDEAVGQRQELVTGAFADRYADLVTDEVAPAAKKQKVVTRTEVASAGVIDATKKTVHLLVFVNQVSAKAGSDVPVLSGSRIRVQMRLIDGSWRVAAVDPV